MRRSHFLLFCLLILPLAGQQLRTLKPTGFNVFSPQQDIQLGQEAKAQVEKEQPVWHNRDVDSYLNDLGHKLGSSSKAGQFPFSFEVVKDKNINAFARPGGPIFVNTATFLAADNEAQLAGVVAHEMSHVALRHGTNQASKGQVIQLLAGLAGGAGQNGGLMGTLAKAGVGLGANSLLLHYSRDAESQADYNGAQIMADGGYDPIQMAQFFQKLETRGSEGTLAQFLSDHPTPGNRVKAVTDEVKLMPQRQYSSDAERFRQIQNIVRSAQ
jgi:beta-barrel assembly-enhancing protease